jgi:hypothetical protein
MVLFAVAPCWPAGSADADGRAVPSPASLWAPYLPVLLVGVLGAVVMRGLGSVLCRSSSSWGAPARRHRGGDPALLPRGDHPSGP